MNLLFSLLFWVLRCGWMLIAAGLIWLTLWLGISWHEMMREPYDVPRTITIGSQRVEFFHPDRVRVNEEQQLTIRTSAVSSLAPAEKLEIRVSASDPSVSIEPSHLERDVGGGRLSRQAKLDLAYGNPPQLPESFVLRLTVRTPGRTGVTESEVAVASRSAATVKSLLALLTALGAVVALIKGLVSLFGGGG